MLRVVSGVDEEESVPGVSARPAVLPMGLRYIEGITISTTPCAHGPTTLFAAQDGANGTVQPQCKLKHPHQSVRA